LSQSARATEVDHLLSSSVFSPPLSSHHFLLYIPSCITSRRPFLTLPTQRVANVPELQEGRAIQTKSTLLLHTNGEQKEKVYSRFFFIIAVPPPPPPSPPCPPVTTIPASNSTLKLLSSAFAACSSWLGESLKKRDAKAYVSTAYVTWYLEGKTYLLS
jgi:hypothetical protein